ncbi:SusC/RagA family TonB-linked outer membrane protein [Gaoshiqia sediminis]|uniref:TonB-dependent receptor n=1 Tax=Gaoshiqia sediminis TaxID=2986998 RepID=A0AA41Y6B1_9BACT|nr:SusC/RagA family TonB-linked outer membrane protein [Gaoshiqia sediminis]MCW0484221.1 TonB-dependent receptor [Gaoshiqia sediminis]
MKLTTLIIFLSVFHVSASIYSQNTKLNINLSGKTVKDVLVEIEEQSKFHFLYNDEFADLDRIVTVNTEEANVEEVLDQIFSNSSVTYKVMKNNLIVLTPSGVNNLAVQSKVVKGVVKDKQGMPLPGVTVLEKGTTNGTITDFDGYYSLEVPADAMLLFSFVGMQVQEIAVAGQATINVVLEEEMLDIDEVVVVGYGTQKKGSITGAIAQFDAEQLDERPVQRIDQALVGQMAGVRVKQTSGMPGKGFSIQVRGTGSITANNEPLYVIDGFPLETSQQSTSGGFSTGNPLDNINPNDIESIQVLKDAAAAAIYGSRASNGVVLITTKKGKAGKSTISLNMYTGWSEPNRKMDLLNTDEWIDRAKEVMNYTYLAKDPGTQNRQATDDYATRLANIGSFDRNQMPDPEWDLPGYGKYMPVDWQDEIFRKGLVQSYQLSANGGNEGVKYFVSGDYLNQEAYFINVDYERFSVRANVEVTPNKKVTAGINIAPSYSIGNDPGVEGKDNILHVAVGMPPLTEEAVGLDMNIGDNTTLTYGNSRNSPVRVLENTTGLTKIFRTLATIYGQYELIDGLKLKSTVNLDNTDQRYKFYRPAFVSGSGPSARVASGRYSGYNRQTFVNENTVSYDKIIKENHNISAVAGLSFSTNKFESYRLASTGGFGTDYITTLNDAVDINANATDTYESKNTLMSYFGRINYSFMDRYLLTASIRRDGSSRFGRDTKWGVFPSASIGWRISEEDFMDNIDWLSNLKARVSWGKAGNNGFSQDYAHIALLTGADYSFNGSKVVGQASGNFPNKDLGWEESETFNYGLDFGVLENRLFGSLEYYTKTNTNLLLSIPVPTATGFSTALTNIGEVFNSGWELELNSRNFTGEFVWNTTFNLSFNKNEVRQLGPDNAPILGGAWDIQHNILQVGQPMYSIYVVQQDGILSAADIAAGAARYGNQVEGDPKYVDQLTVDTNSDGIPDQADGVITPDDRVISGHPNPDYVWGITNSFKYKGFDLSILIQGQQGGVLYSTFGRAMDRTGMGWLDQAIGAWRDRWRSPEDPGAGLKGKAYSTFGRIKNTDWMYSNDYWRIRNITLGYDLGKLIRSNVISGARLYVTAENWFGDDKYFGGFNPEAVNNSGDDYGGAPLPKSMIFGLNVTF